MLENDSQLENTRKLLEELQDQIAEARMRPPTPENAESLQSLIRTSNQLREEIVRYQTVRRRLADPV
jgi:hypothetical protein